MAHWVKLFSIKPCNPCLKPRTHVMGRELSCDLHTHEHPGMSMSLHTDQCEGRGGGEGIREKQDGGEEGRRKRKQREIEDINVVNFVSFLHSPILWSCSSFFFFFCLKQP